MALGSDRKSRTSISDTTRVSIASLVSEWVEVIEAGGMDARDGAVAGVIQNPTTDITAADHHILDCSDMTHPIMCVEACFAYAGTPNADPAVVCFGRVKSAAGEFSRWELLQNMEDTADIDPTLVTDETTDATDGTLFYTVVDAKKHRWDGRGNNQFIWGVKVAYTVSAGSAATAKLLARAL
jgi:hypothetical protein